MCYKFKVEVSTTLLILNSDSRYFFFFFFLKLIELLNTGYDQFWNFSFSYNHSEVRFSVNIELNYCGQNKNSLIFFRGSMIRRYFVDWK